MHVHLDGTCQAVGGWLEDVGRAPAAVPEILRAVLVGYEQQCYRRVGLRWVDADSRGWKVFGCGVGEGLLQRAYEVRVRRV